MILTHLLSPSTHLLSRLAIAVGTIGRDLGVCRQFPYMGMSAEEGRLPFPSEELPERPHSPSTPAPRAAPSPGSGALGCLIALTGKRFFLMSPN